MNTELKKEVLSISSSLEMLIDNLPEGIRPRHYAGFGSNQLSLNKSYLEGWNTDWHDTGPDPPPWSDNWQDSGD